MLTLASAFPFIRQNRLSANLALLSQPGTTSPPVELIHLFISACQLVQWGQSVRISTLDPTQSLF